MLPCPPLGRIPPVLLAGLLFGLASCSGNPTSPSPVSIPPAAIRTFDGWTDRPLDASSAQVPHDGLTFTASGYLPRSQAATPEVFLWPADEAYVRSIVYGPYVPAGRLSRWQSGFTIALDGALANDPEVLDVTEQAAAEASRATGLPISVGPIGQVIIAVDAEAIGRSAVPALALTFNTFSGNTILSSRVVFAARDYITTGFEHGLYRNMLLHELGHALGLNHSSDPADVMNVSEPYLRRNERTFGEKEQVALRLTYHYRSPGNEAPDTAPAAQATGGMRQTITIIDGIGR